jgi:hypothetical protein
MRRKAEQASRELARQQHQLEQSQRAMSAPTKDNMSNRWKKAKNFFQKQKGGKGGAGNNGSSSSSSSNKGKGGGKNKQGASWYGWN